MSFSTRQKRKITKAYFYDNGGFSNSDFMRTSVNGRWVYWYIGY